MNPHLAPSRQRPPRGRSGRAPRDSERAPARPGDSASRTREHVARSGPRQTFDQHRPRPKRSHRTLPHARARLAAPRDGTRMRGFDPKRGDGSRPHGYVMPRPRPRTNYTSRTRCPLPLALPRVSREGASGRGGKPAWGRIPEPRCNPLAMRWRPLEACGLDRLAGRPVPGGGRNLTLRPYGRRRFEAVRATQIGNGLQRGRWTFSRGVTTPSRCSTATRSRPCRTSSCPTGWAGNPPGRCP
jgi:hypothetical protein